MKKLYAFSRTAKPMPLLRLLLAFLLFSLPLTNTNAQQKSISGTKILTSPGQRLQQQLQHKNVSSVAEPTMHRLAATTSSKPRTKVEYHYFGTGWQQYSTTTFTYDQTGRETERIVQDGDNYLRTTTTYDTQGNITEELLHYRMGGNWIFSTGSQNLFYYNTNNSISEEVQNIWEDGNWRTLQRFDYTYNISGDLTKISYFYKHDNTWEEVIYTLTYSAPNTSPTGIHISNPSENEEIRLTDMTWHQFTPGHFDNLFDKDAWSSYTLQEKVNGNWVNLLKYAATYDSNGGFTGNLQSWSNGSWVNDSRITVNMDTQGNLLLDQEEEWANNTWSIAYGSKYINTYNASGQLTETIWQTFDESARVYVNYSRSVYSNFQTITSSSVEAQLISTEIYPNPTNGILSLRLAKAGLSADLTIMDITGKIVYSKQLAPATLQHELDLSAFSPGLYLLQVNAGDAKISRKVIKQ